METETQTLKFQVHGDFLTDLIRSLWVESDLYACTNILEASGCPKEYWLDVVTGKLTMTGINTLNLADDDATEKHTIPLNIEDSVKRFEKAYVNQQIIYNQAHVRLSYWPFRMDIEGVHYKTGKYTTDLGYNSSVDEKIIEKSAEVLVRLSPLFDWIYPIIGKELKDFDHSEILDALYMTEQQCDWDHPRLLFNMRDKHRKGKGLDTYNVRSLFDLEFKLGELQEQADNGQENLKIQERIVEKNNIGVDRVVTNPWPDISYSCRAEDLEKDEIIPSTWGEGIAIVDGNNLYESKEHNKPRELRLEISTFKGVSMDAVHYYGSLVSNSTQFYENGGGGNLISSAFPKASQGVKVNVTSPLTQDEFNRDPLRWETWKVGNYMNAYTTEDELKDVARKIFNQHFDEGWKLKI